MELVNDTCKGYAPESGDNVKSTTNGWIIVTLPFLALYPKLPSSNTALATLTGTTDPAAVSGAANFTHSKVPVPLTGLAPAAAINKEVSVAFVARDHPAAPAKPWPVSTLTTFKWFWNPVSLNSAEIILVSKGTITSTATITVSPVATYVSSTCTLTGRIIGAESQFE